MRMGHCLHGEDVSRLGERADAEESSRNSGTAKRMINRQRVQRTERPLGGIGVVRCGGELGDRVVGGVNQQFVVIAIAGRQLICRAFAE